jgi:hypothetical protein
MARVGEARAVLRELPATVIASPIFIVFDVSPDGPGPFEPIDQSINPYASSWIWTWDS